MNTLVAAAPAPADGAQLTQLPGSQYVHFELTPAGFQWRPAQLDHLNRVSLLTLVEILNQYAAYRSF